MLTDGIHNEICGFPEYLTSKKKINVTASYLNYSVKPSFY